MYIFKRVGGQELDFGDFGCLARKSGAADDDRPEPR
jgi:hypothetical protein